MTIVNLTDEEAEIVSRSLEAVLAFGHGMLRDTAGDDDLLEGVLVKLDQKRNWTTPKGPA